MTTCPAISRQSRHIWTSPGAQSRTKKLKKLETLGLFMGLVLAPRSLQLACTFIKLRDSACTSFTGLQTASLFRGSSWFDKPWHFQFFRIFWSRTGPRDPSRCVGIAEISLGAWSKSDLVGFLLKKYTFRPNSSLQALLIRFWGL